MARVRLRAVLAAAGAAALLLSACNGGTDTDTDIETDDVAAADGEPLRVGIVTSTSGFLGAYGNAYLDGLQAGLDDATNGTLVL